MLYTTKQIAEIYSGKKGNVTTHMIYKWNYEGLKHIRGKGKGYLYKKEWVEEFIEDKASREAFEKLQPNRKFLYKNGKLDKKLLEDLEYARKYNKVR